MGRSTRDLPWSPGHRRGGSRGRTPGWVVAVALAAGAASPAPGGAQEPPPTLAQEVRAWLARDQVPRWARMIEKGDSLFHAGSCRRCHGEGGVGGRFGPDLTDSVWARSAGSLEEIRETIFWGVQRSEFSEPSWRFEMHPGGGMGLEWDGYDALTAYVWSRSNESGLPGG